MAMASARQHGSSLAAMATQQSSSGFQSGNLALYWALAFGFGGKNIYYNGPSKRVAVLLPYALTRTQKHADSELMCAVLY